MRFGKEMFGARRSKLEALLGTYFEEGGAQAMITVVGREDLEAAMREPEKWGHLMVRVGGFSARFVELTVSGGEPLAQVSFTRGLFHAARQAGIHNCLDTCGAGNAEDLEALLPMTDVVLFDYKATGADTHRALTGADGGALRANLDRVLSSGTPVVLRVPLVPGLNDSEDHLAAIAALAARHPLQAVDVMPYHALGRDKRRRLGLPETPTRPRATSRQSRAWLQALASRGCVARIG